MLEPWRTGSLFRHAGNAAAEARRPRRDVPVMIEDNAGIPELTEAERISLQATESVVVAMGAALDNAWR